jgi:hypothetical protein
MNSTNKHARTLIAAVIGLSLSAGACAARTDFLGGIRFNAGLPQGAWEDRIDTEAFGASGQIFYAPDTSPVAIGLDLGWSNYGSDSREEPFGPAIPDVTVKVENWNNFVQGFFVLRGQVPRGPLQVYGDALVGFNYLYTESKVTDDDGGHDIASTTNQDDTAFACGLGGGVLAPVWQRSGDHRGVEQVSIDVGARYIWGGQAEYLKEGSIQRENGRVSFETIESRTNLTQVHLGVSARF